MKYKCDQCDRPATYHAVEIVNGQKIEKHLCDQCAEAESPGSELVQTPLGELLTNYMKVHHAIEKPVEMGSSHVVCPDCGMDFNTFRAHSLMGCAGCYDAFQASLVGLLERAHESGDRHVGKVPRRGGVVSEHRRLQIMHIRRRLNDAIEAEDYELAAQLRDDLAGLEAGHGSQS